MWTLLGKYCWVYSYYYRDCVWSPVVILCWFSSTSLSFSVCLALDAGLMSLVVVAVISIIFCRHRRSCSCCCCCRLCWDFPKRFCGFYPLNATLVQVLAMSVSVSVCLSVTVTRRYCIETAAHIKLILALGLSSTYPLNCVLRKLKFLHKIRVLHLGTLFQAADLGNLATERPPSPSAWDKQAIIVGLLLITPGDDDGRHGQVPSTADRRPSPVNHTQRPALCTARWAWRSASSGSVGVSWYLRVMVETSRITTNCKSDCRVIAVIYIQLYFTITTW